MAWLEAPVAYAERLAAVADDNDVFAAILAVIRRHGPGPYPADEMAVIAGRAPEAVRRVLAEMDAEGLLRRAGPEDW